MTTTSSSSQASASTQTWTHRVQALLAKAESTQFPEEAEALVAKAQQLMARHAIDEAMLAGTGKASHDPVVTESIAVEAPYAVAKSSLLAAVAEANGCRAVMSAGQGGVRHCILVGHEADVANAQTLFATLSIHAVRSMLTAQIPPHDTVRRFRHAFLLAFAERIAQRLREAAATARAEAAAETGAGQQMSIVLADRGAAVDRAFREAFPRVRYTSTSSSSFAGRASGRSAADRAGLGSRGVNGGGRTQRAL